MPLLALPAPPAARAALAAPPPAGSLCEYMGHDVSNMMGFDSYRLLTLFLAALMTRISSAMIEGAQTSAGAPHSPGPSPSGAGSAARESRQRGRAAGAYCRVPQTLRRPAITYRLSCVMVGMSKRHHLGSCDLKPASCMGGPDVDRRPMTTVKLSRNESTSLV